MRARHYWVIGWRNLRKYWIGNLLSLAGLVVGFALALVVGVRFWEAWSDNMNVPDVERVYDIRERFTDLQGEEQEGWGVPIKTIDFIKDGLPGMEELSFELLMFGIRFHLSCCAAAIALLCQWTGILCSCRVLGRS